MTSIYGVNGRLVWAPVPPTDEMQWDCIWKQNSLTVQFVNNKTYYKNMDI